jgi:SET domain-containing protein
VTQVRPDCWLHPAIDVRTSSIEGRGWFATAPIASGEPIARLGGRLVSDGELRSLLAQRALDPSLPYLDSISHDDGLNLVLPSGTSVHYGNHSCDPNAWWVDQVTVAARADVEPGQEITTDYGTSTSEPSWRMSCSVGPRSAGAT